MAIDGFDELPEGPREESFSGEFTEALNERLGEGWMQPERRKEFIDTVQELVEGAFREKQVGVIEADDLRQGFAILFTDGSLITFCTQAVEEEIKTKARMRLSVYRSLGAIEELFGIKLDEPPGSEEEKEEIKG